MKQAQADADDLIAAYRREQQDAFDKKVLTDGEFISTFIFRGILWKLSFSHSTLTQQYHRRIWWKRLGPTPSRNDKRNRRNARAISIKRTKGR